MRQIPYIAKKSIITACLLSIFGISCVKNACQRPGSAESPVRLLLYPSSHSTKAQAAGRTIARLLAANSGLNVVARVPIDYLHAVKDLGECKADVGFLSNFSYLLARETYQARTSLRVQRRGSLQRHRGQLLVRADSGIKTLADLAGKRVAYVDPYSVTGFVLAAHLLSTRHVELAASTFVGSHEEAVRQVYTGDVDVCATFVDDAADGVVPQGIQQQLISRYPDLAKVLKSVATTIDVPNEPVVLRSGIDADTEAKIVKGLHFAATQEEGLQALRELGDIVGFSQSSVDDYDELSSILTALDKNVEEMLPGAWRLKLRVSDSVREQPNKR